MSKLIMKKEENNDELILQILFRDFPRVANQIMDYIDETKWKEEKDLQSDCCGAETIETDMGICPECLEHCEFIYEDDE